VIRAGRKISTLSFVPYLTTSAIVPSGHRILPCFGNTCRSLWEWTLLWDAHGSVLTARIQNYIGPPSLLPHHLPFSLPPSLPPSLQSSLRVSHPPSLPCGRLDSAGHTNGRPATPTADGRPPGPVIKPCLTMCLQRVSIYLW
jgi:hypothetical protein